MKPLTPPRAALCAALLAGLLCGVGGCGNSVEATTPADSSRTAALLQDALSAWKAGVEHNATTRQTPPFRAADEDWLAGKVLVDFSIAPSTGHPLGNAVLHDATLTISDKQGKPIKRQVVYRVTPEPNSSVIRED
jgi:hypothetical protein